MFEKYDGVRAFWNPVKKAFYSRKGKKLFIPQEIIDAMPNNVFLDGEFWYNLFILYLKNCYIPLMHKYLDAVGLGETIMRRLQSLTRARMPIKLIGANSNTWYSMCLHPMLPMQSAMLSYVSKLLPSHYVSSTHITLIGIYQ